MRDASAVEEAIIESARHTGQLIGVLGRRKPGCCAWQRHRHERTTRKMKRMAEEG